MVQSRGERKGADVPQCWITEGATMIRRRSIALDVAALMLLAAIVLIVLVLIGHVHAEPMPVPKGSGQCPSSYASEAA
jgi:hypothetical protein